MIGSLFLTKRLVYVIKWPSITDIFVRYFGLIGEFEWLYWVYMSFIYTSLTWVQFTLSPDFSSHCFYSSWLLGNNFEVWAQLQSLDGVIVNFTFSMHYMQFVEMSLALLTPKLLWIKFFFYMNTGSAVKTSRYTEAAWFNGSFSKVAKAGQVAGSKTWEKFHMVMSNLTAKDPIAA